MAYALYCVWQFMFTWNGVDPRYLLLFVQYLPISLACTWAYDNGGSVWTPIGLHAVINLFTLVWSL